ncbi:hypothetical protein [Acidaminobacter hydrogenoformans]|uniref:Uncharacterized protein n=1 Tax=Acidaminobacter hydrogenoformans DSM 2784 TaxID=1120920 RepID=A0A1G5RZX0_9FIRM|nr:hypothetical protein [Acidaminobacter hydrogenoformans]SCZ79457.1 hypothetical protein SAMN03080599_01768 [Acidaminobacter hydrogenoformans DSM 2784]
MLTDYAYTLPMIFLVIFVEYKKKLFLREASMKDVTVRNIKPNLIRLKTYAYYVFALLFTLLYKDAAVAVRENVDPRFIGPLISSFVLIFMVVSLFLLRINKDFYIKENVIHFFYKGNVRVPEGVKAEELSTGKDYTTVRLLENSGLVEKQDRIKLHVYSENRALFYQYISHTARS